MPQGSRHPFSLMAVPRPHRFFFCGTLAFSQPPKSAAGRGVGSFIPWADLPGAAAPVDGAGCFSLGGDHVFSASRSEAQPGTAGRQASGAAPLEKDVVYYGAVMVTIVVDA